MKKILKKIHSKVFHDFVYEFGKELKGMNSVLDVGCGASSPIKEFSNNFYSVGVDAFKPSIEKSKKNKIHNEEYFMDVMDINKKFKKNSFDCVIAIDLIEHLSKEDGLILIKRMEEIAKKKIIIFTPNGFLEQGVYDNNKWQIHNSGWGVKEMKNLGYRVIGINGWKPLRGDYAKIKYKPRYLWLIVSDITQLFLRKMPESAFQILCVKKKNT